MAKTRVYELARDLNLTNKMLLNKLSELDISVKSHMSSLDDEIIGRIKTMLYGKKEESIGNACKTDRHPKTQKKSESRNCT